MAVRDGKFIAVGTRAEVGAAAGPAGFLAATAMGGLRAQPSSSESGRQSAAAGSAGGGPATNSCTQA